MEPDKVQCDRPLYNSHPPSCTNTKLTVIRDEEGEALSSAQRCCVPPGKQQSGTGFEMMTASSLHVTVDAV